MHLYSVNSQRDINNLKNKINSSSLNLTEDQENSLNSGINKELVGTISTNKSDITNLQTSISTETTNRETKDTELQNSIDVLKGTGEGSISKIVSDAIKSEVVSSLDVTVPDKQLRYSFIQSPNNYVVATFKYNNDLYYMTQNSTDAASATVSIYKDTSLTPVYTSSYAVNLSLPTESSNYILTNEYIYLIEYDNLHLHAVKLSDFTDKVVSENTFDEPPINNRVRDKLYFLNTAGDSFIDINGNVFDTEVVDAKIIIVSDDNDYVAVGSNSFEIRLDNVVKTINKKTYLIFNSDDFNSISSTEETQIGKAVQPTGDEGKLAPVKTPLYIQDDEGAASYISNRKLKEWTVSDVMPVPAFTKDFVGIYSATSTFIYVIDENTNGIIGVENTRSGSAMIFNDGLPNGFNSFETLGEQKSIITVNEDGIDVKEGVSISVTTTDVTFTNLKADNLNVAKTITTDVINSNNGCIKTLNSNNVNITNCLCIDGDTTGAGATFTNLKADAISSKDTNTFIENKLISTDGEIHTPNISVCNIKPYSDNNNTLDVSHNNVSVKNLTVTGNLIQTGSSYDTHAEDLYIKDSCIKLRDGATVAMSNTEKAGLSVLKYNGTDDMNLFIDNNGIARLGKQSSLQPLTLRNEETSMTNGKLVCWNSADKRVETSTCSVSDIDTKITNCYNNVNNKITALCSGDIAYKNKANIFTCLQTIKGEGTLLYIINYGCAGGAGVRVHNVKAGCRIELCVDDSGNGGIYDLTKSKWLINKSGDKVYINECPAVCVTSFDASSGTLCLG